MNQPAPDDRLEAELRRLRPAAPSPALGDGLVAALAGPRPTPAGKFRWLAERLAWAAAGALAAAVVVAVWPRADSGPPAPAAATAAAAGAETTAAEVSEAAIAWADDGVQFLADRTPARVLRRLVVERHRAGDGPELRVPREDVIVLPVALQ